MSEPLTLPCPACGGPVPLVAWRVSICPDCWRQLVNDRYDLARAVMDTWQPGGRSTNQHRAAIDEAVRVLKLPLNPVVEVAL